MLLRKLSQLSGQVVASKFNGEKAGLSAHNLISTHVDLAAQYVLGFAQPFVGN
jgi:hypothetical protein